MTPLPTPTLAEVLTALDNAAQRAKESPTWEGTIASAYRFAGVASRYIQANRARLERMDWEHSARCFVSGLRSDAMDLPVIVQPGNTPPYVQTLGYFEAPLIVVGRDWRPEGGSK